MALEVALDGRVGTVKAVAGLAARAGVKAALTSNHTAALSDVTLTAVSNGTWGNDIRVLYVVPDVASSALKVTVVGKIITVSLATDGAKAATSTATQVIAALAASVPAAALVVATKEGAGTGACNALAMTPLAGGVDAAVLPTGGKFEVWAIDATNAKILPYLDADRDYFKGTDACVVSLADLVTACTAP